MCGLGSRRRVEDLVRQGRISVNSALVEALATQITPDEDIVTLDGYPIRPFDAPQFIIMNKPEGYITSMKDTHNRPTVLDILPEHFKKFGVFPVGRLDKNTEGLLLFTNDGDLAYRLSRPEFKVPKKYHVIINKPLDDNAKSRLEKGLYVDQIRVTTRPAQVEILDSDRIKIQLTIIEGKKRQVRYMFKTLGCRVNKLIRVAYGPLTLDGVPIGSCRLLEPEEVLSLRSLAGLS